MKRKNKIFRTIIQFLILMLVAGYFTSNFIEYTFAANVGSPNVIVTIDGNGSMSHQGSLFDGSLFPSSELDAENGIGSIKGVIRLENNYEQIDVENISIGLNLSQMDIRNNYPRDEVYNSFLDNIRLKIEKGRAFNFDKILVGYTSLRNLLFDANNGEYSGYNLTDNNKFSLNKGDSVDLKYTLHMVEEAGNELQSITTIMPIYINLKGSQINGGDGNGDGDDDNTPPIDVPVIDDEEVDFDNITPEAQPKPEPDVEEEIIIEEPIPETQPEPETEVEEPVEEEIEINEEIPQAVPSTGLPRTGTASPLLSVGLGTIILGIGLFLRKKKD